MCMGRSKNLKTCMKSSALKFIFIVFLILIGGCISEVPETDYEDIENDTSTSPTYTETSAVASSSDNFVINLSQQIKINPIQNFPYYTDGDKPGNNNISFNVVFEPNKINITLVENNFRWLWEGELNNSWDALFTIDGVQYSTKTGEYNLVLYLNNNKELYKLQLGNRTFLKSQNISNKTPPLKYMDNYQVVVRKGDTLKDLVIKYNTENPNTPVTIQEIVNKNPQIKRRKNYYLVTNEIINF